MHQIAEFLKTEPVLALIIACLIFATTILLVVKRWIGFSLALLLLLFSLAAGLLINNQQAFQLYLNSRTTTNLSSDGESQDTFRKQVSQAVEDLKLEVNTEKENLKRVMHQVQEIVDSIDVQKQKLQTFIDETRVKFKSDTSPKPANSETDSQ